MAGRRFSITILADRSRFLSIVGDFSRSVPNLDIACRFWRFRRETGHFGPENAVVSDLSRVKVDDHHPSPHFTEAL
jgi:hypothetical protein